jgi:hypothetical protein
MSYLPRVHIEEVSEPVVVHQDAPVVKKEIIVQHPEVVHREHHVQPIIHETERRVEPVYRTVVTTEHPVTHREVVVDEPGLDHHHHHHLERTTTGSDLVPRAAKETVIVEDPPVVERKVVHEHPEIIHHEHHIQPIIRETERHIEPIHKTEITTEHPVTYQEVVVKDPALVARPVVVASREVGGATRTYHHHSSHATMGQKLKGTMTQLMGSITGNEAKKEKGRLLKQGVDPTTRVTPTAPVTTTTTTMTTTHADVYPTTAQHI